MRAKPKPPRHAATAVLLGAALAVTAAAEAPAPAGNAAHGARLAYTCFGCHGIPDYRNAYPDYHVPRIGGQHAAYLVAALTEYRDGARHHPTMSGQASSFDDQAIRDLAAFFAGAHPVLPVARPIGEVPAAAAVCQACHGTDGVGVLPEYPTLTGQQPDYIVQALKAYRSGRRQNPIMKGFAATLKDADMEALARYFAAQQPGLTTPEAPQHPGG